MIDTCSNTYKDSEITYLNFFYDKNKFLSGYKDGIIKIWEIIFPKLDLTIEEQKDITEKDYSFEITGILPGHNDKITSCGIKIDN